jgi:ubiquinone/menaquinone biosynthesis C-methylase UbiE
MNSPSIHANNFDRVADTYDATRGFSPAVEAEVGDGLAAILRAHAPDPAPSVLEIGVGSGRIAVPLAVRGIRVTGLDISRQMLRRLLDKRRDIDVLLAEASKPPFRPNSFDAAIFVHILHLVPDARTTLAAAIACVRPGGILLNCHHTYSPDAADKASVRLTEIVRDVTRIAARRPHGRSEGTDELFREVLSAAGATIETTEIAGWTETTTARSEIEMLKNRGHSGTWAIPEDAMPEVLARFSADAEAIYGGMDLPSVAPVSFSVMLAVLPR